MSDVATERVGAEVRPEELARLERAAELSNQDVHTFVITAALERADAVLGREGAPPPVVHDSARAKPALAADMAGSEPHVFFAELLSALEAAGNPHTARKRVASVVVRTVDIRD